MLFCASLEDNVDFCNVFELESAGSGSDVGRDSEYTLSTVMILGNWSVLMQGAVT